MILGIHIQTEMPSYMMTCSLNTRCWRIQIWLSGLVWSTGHWFGFVLHNKEHAWVESWTHQWSLWIWLVLPIDDKRGLHEGLMRPSVVLWGHCTCFSSSRWHRQSFLRSIQLVRWKKICLVCSFQRTCLVSLLLGKSVLENHRLLNWDHQSVEPRGTWGVYGCTIGLPWAPHHVLGCTVSLGGRIRSHWGRALGSVGLHKGGMMVSLDKIRIVRQY